MDIIEIKNFIIEIADTIAAAVLKHQSPTDDEISYNEAKRKFSAPWIKYHEDRGNITWTRRGQYKNSPKVTSRTKLLALRDSEKLGVQIARKEINKQA